MTTTLGLRKYLNSKHDRISVKMRSALFNSALLTAIVIGTGSCGRNVPQVPTTEGPAGTASRPGTTVLQPGTTFSADPNPILFSHAQKDGSVKLSWTSQAQKITIHVDSPAGQVIANGEGSGSVTTGKVANGTTFYLQDAKAGNPLDKTATLATVTMQVADQRGRNKNENAK